MFCYIATVLTRTMNVMDVNSDVNVDVSGWRERTKS